MTRHGKQVLFELSKEQLIYLIEQFRYSQLLIGCVLIDESKGHIDSDRAIDKIRSHMYHMPSLDSATELKTYIDMKMEKISIDDYRKITGLD